MKTDKRSITKAGLVVFLLILALIYREAVLGFIIKIFDVCSPIFIGLVIAYILNILMSFYERHYFTKYEKRKIVIKSKKPVCLIASVITFAGIIALLIKLVIPELVSCIRLLASGIPDAMDKVLANEFMTQILPENIIKSLSSIDWKEFAKTITNGLGTAAETIFTAVSSVISSIATAFISIVFSIYLLLDRENLLNQSRRILDAFLPEKFNLRARYVLHVLNDSFKKYIVGQFSEALILGGLCIIGMLILRLPYAVMIGTLIGFTALIPIAGAYIGAAVGAIMIFTVSPIKALFFLIFIVVLQQIEGNLIYPKVVGKSIGLPAIFVLTAITIGGGLMGIGGMLIGVPITSALYRLVREELHSREKEESEMSVEE
ncbi:MAG: AI-2E family transporter [Clostridia bacterium]|nr:AI-2E family transporter [Clostridia bacterium]